MLPVLTYTQPTAAADALRWRHATLDLALERAKTLELKGAAFPWRTIRGQECSAYWPAGHGGVPRQRRHRGRRHPLRPGHRRRGVRGHHRPGAARAHRAAVALARPSRPRGPLPHRRRHRPGRVLRDRRRQRLHEPDGRAEPAPRRARRLAPHRPGADARRRRGGDRRLARRGGRDPRPVRRAPAGAPAGRGLHQATSCSSSTASQYPLLLHVPYFRLYSTQVVKQADLVLALYMRGNHFTAEQKARDFAYYEPITVRDSSLSRVRAGRRRGRGRPPGARLRLLRRGRPDGPRRPDGQHPRRAAHRVAGRLLDRGRGRVRRDARLRRRPVASARGCRTRSRGWSSGCATATARSGFESATATSPTSCVDGDPIEILHYDEPILIDGPVTREWHVDDPGPEPKQPPGREPRHRRVAWLTSLRL